MATLTGQGSNGPSSSTGPSTGSSTGPTATAGSVLGGSTPQAIQHHGLTPNRRPSMLRNPSSTTAGGAAGTAASAAAVAAVAGSHSTSSIHLHQMKRTASGGKLGANPATSGHAGGHVGGTGSSSTVLQVGGNAISTPNTHTGTSSSTRPNIGRTRSRSFTLTNNSSTSASSIKRPLAIPYVAQERAYLRKIRNESADDYYTKGIASEDPTGEPRDMTLKDDITDVEDTESDFEEEEEDLDSGGEDGYKGYNGFRDYDWTGEKKAQNQNLAQSLAQSLVPALVPGLGQTTSGTGEDDNNYSLDFSLALTMMNSSSSSITINPSKPSSQLSLRNSDDPAVIERLEWQSMLTSVLTGDVVRSEKTKIITNNPDNEHESSFIHVTYKENLWFGIRAKLFNRTEDDQRKVVAYRRTLVDTVIDEIMQFEVSYEKDAKLPRRQVEILLDKWEKCCECWRTWEEMKTDKVVCRSEEFQERIDALNSWLSITGGLERESRVVREWIGDEDPVIPTPNEQQTGIDCKNNNIAESPLEENVLLTESTLNGSVATSATATPISPTNPELRQKGDGDRDPAFHGTGASTGTAALAERLMKEKDVQSTFSKRIFSPITPWMSKAKKNYIQRGYIFEKLKLPDYIHDLIQICLFPTRLIKEIISIRLQYAMKLQNPTLMMIDQMIDDFKLYITIALQVKRVIIEYCRPDDVHNWLISDFFEEELAEFDHVVLQCVRYFLVLLNRKLLDSLRSPTNFRTFKEPEELEEAWHFLKCLGNYIDGGSVVVAEHITFLALKLIHRLLAYLNNQVRHPPHLPSTTAADLIRWYTSTTQNFGQLRRKLARFTGEISRDFTNLVVLEMPLTRVKQLLDVLRRTGHFLVYTGTLETQGIYFIASPEMEGREQEILKILQGGYVGLDGEAKDEFVEFLVNLDDDEEGLGGLSRSGSQREKESSDASSNANVGSGGAAGYGSRRGTIAEADQPLLTPYEAGSYVLAICPPKPIVWEGNLINLAMDDVPLLEIRPGQLLLISKHPHHRLPQVRAQFLDIVSDVLRTHTFEQRCSLARVHHQLTRIYRVFFKTSLVVLDSVQIVRAKCTEIAPLGDFQELINNYFIYARDYVKNSVKLLDANRKSTVIMKLMQLAIEWVSFICDDCIPTDRKTFRWCVLALEFAMNMTTGFNVFVLNEDQFYRLKLKVARCMSLLISHFDVMGARSSEASKKMMAKWTLSKQNKIENTVDDEKVLLASRELMMKGIERVELIRSALEDEQSQVGRVLEVTDLEYQFVTLLASSFSSVSIRWQKGRFIGGGSFGNVYAAVNLDTGGVMAVKEIRFHDSQSIKNIVPSIKDEMTVLEMLNHPNVVQYFGVEVHRDKVYIFMEFCEGGSLSGLLTHGRIEDEMVIQVYTLQMLEGLAYLHQLGVVHRDIKPENILLDHNGVIKFVDFGAAKVIATSGRTRAGGTKQSDRSNSTSSESSSLDSGETSPDGNSRTTNNNGGAAVAGPVGSMTGTPMYMSPEVITGISSDKNGVVDIWSLGCCVLEMATGRRPWANLDNEWAIMYHIAAGHMPQLPLPDQLSEQGRRFLLRCLEHDPRKRPSAIELLNDPWIDEIRQLAFDSSDTASTPSSETVVELM